MHIRGFNKEQDFEYIANTFEEMYGSNKDFRPTARGLELFKEVILSYKDKKGVTYVLDSEGKPVGYLCLEFREGKSGIRKIIIAKIYIDKTLRGKGFGKLLVEKAKEVAKDKGFERLELNSFEDNKGFYEKLGFSSVSYWMQLKV